MEKPPLRLTEAEDIDDEIPPDFDRNSSGIWALDGDRLASVEDFDEGPAVALVGNEHVLLLAVPLPPIASLSKRREALPFAIEERIAEPLEAVHVALGDELAPGVFLAGVVRHDLMRQWIETLRQAGLDHASLVPDALSLPVPGAESWAVDVAGERALVRTPDSGFAMPTRLLEQAWKAAGEPDSIAYGDPLPPQMHAAALQLDAEPLARRLLAPALDLRQGPYALPSRPVHALWKRVAIVAALGAAAHAGIAAAETMILQNMAEEREAEVRLLAQNLNSPLTIGPDLGATLAEVAPAGPVAEPGLFLPLLMQAGNALNNMPQPVAWHSARYDAAGGVLTVAVVADDLDGLQAAAAALEAAGLNASAGPPVEEQGRTIATFAVRGR